ncbi:MAG: helix-turn-helix domain-containing protein [Bacteroidia bacterium]|nr:helix-turn-helix domain-containing protein [Bacteroidia bacterium]
MKTQNELPFAMFHCLRLLAEVQEPVYRNYCIQYLRGNLPQTAIRSSLSGELYGILKDYPLIYLIGVFELMHQRGYILIKNPYSGTFVITETGHEYLLFPEPIRNTFTIAPFMKRLPLFRKLCQERMKLATQLQISERKLCSDYFLEQMARFETNSLEKISALPGFRHWQYSHLANDFVKMITTYLTNIRTEKNEIKEDPNRKKVKTPTFQDTKRLFLQGYSAEQIATIKNIKETTVHRYLEILHKTGELNLQSWLMQQYSPDIIEKAKEIFSTPEIQTLRQAAERLNIDYRDARYLKLLIA